jgi:hypothetical protein
VDALRQLAGAAAAEQRRCGLFRDKWINRPLPYEQVRPLLTGVSNRTRDQLADFRHLTEAARRLESLGDLAPRPPVPDDGKLDRRALFNKLVRRDPDPGGSA